MSLSRRTFLTGFSGLTLFSIASSARARVTPWQSLGPFYPKKLPVDSDADLTFVDGKNGQATGQFTRLSGRVTDQSGAPIKNARVEIWQCDAFGAYHHPRDGGGVDTFFQGYGQTTTDDNGNYRFKTIKPVAYPGRAPHIHMKVIDGSRDLVTQIYIKDEPANKGDFLLNAIRNEQSRQSLEVAFEASTDPDESELVARFDPVLG